MKPTAEQRRMVETLSAYGVPPGEICLLIKKDGAEPLREAQLKKIFAKEIESGRAKASAKIGEALYKRATEGNPTAFREWQRLQDSIAASRRTDPPKRKETTTSVKQQRFVDEYLATAELNATQAARRAGYKNPEVLGPRLTKNPAIKAAIDAAIAERQKRTRATADWVLEKLEEVVNRCMQAQPVLDRQGHPVLVETATGETLPAYGFDAAGANRALELLGKHHRLFTDKHEVSGKDGGPIDVRTIRRIIVDTRNPDA